MVTGKVSEVIIVRCRPLFVGSMVLEYCMATGMAHRMHF